MAKTSDQKAKVYSKYAREIYVSAKGGGSDPTGNLALRALLERARKDQVPAHVIEKAIEKANGGGGEDFAVARYEGFGPGGSTVIVDCLTDNPNRTFADVRICFTKTDSKIGSQGSVAHMFDHCAILAFPCEDEETALDVLMSADVDVSEIEAGEGKVTIFAASADAHRARAALLSAFGDIEFDVDEIQFVPHDTVELDDENAEVMQRFLDLLDDVDDVQRVYHNVA